MHEFDLKLTHEIRSELNRIIDSAYGDAKAKGQLGVVENVEWVKAARRCEDLFASLVGPPRFPSSIQFSGDAIDALTALAAWIGDPNKAPEVQTKFGPPAALLLEIKAALEEVERRSKE